jgi:hypothetical protein
VKRLLKKGEMEGSKEIFLIVQRYFGLHPDSEQKLNPHDRIAHARRMKPSYSCQAIKLFDMGGEGCRCWNLNVWQMKKARAGKKGTQSYPPRYCIKRKT